MTMEWLADTFETHRPHLRTVAYRMLGSRTEAEDAVQEAWLRLGRSDTSSVENLGGWLTTVVARVALDMLRSRKARREDGLDAAPILRAPDLEDDALLADSIGAAMLVVLDSLTPGERVAFVLHDMFDLSFDEIGPIVGRSPAAARQLASRARRRVQRAESEPRADRNRKREVVAAFLAASRSGDFVALLGLLDPEVVVRADDAVVAMGSPAEVRGADAVAKTFAGRAVAAEPAWIDGAPGLVWAAGGAPRVIFDFTIEGDRVVAIDMIADAEHIRGLDLAME